MGDLKPSYLGAWTLWAGDFERDSGHAGNGRV